MWPLNWMPSEQFTKGPRWPPEFDATSRPLFLRVTQETNHVAAPEEHPSRRRALSRTLAPDDRGKRPRRTGHHRAPGRGVSVTDGEFALQPRLCTDPGVVHRHPGLRELRLP